jgi:hypothetical protein
MAQSQIVPFSNVKKQSRPYYFTYELIGFWTGKTRWPAIQKLDMFLSGFWTFPVFGCPLFRLLVPSFLKFL